MTSGPLPEPIALGVSEPITLGEPIAQAAAAALPLQGGAPYLGVPLPDPLVVDREPAPARPLDGRRWPLLCASLDFVLATVAVLIALRAFPSGLRLTAERSTVLALPVFVVALLGMRGIYRRRLRVLLLDWLPSVLSAISVATMAAAMLDLLINGRISDGSIWVRVWVLTVATVGAGRILLAFGNRQARVRGMLSRPVLILGAGVVGARVAKRLEAHPEYGLAPVGFLDDDPLSVAGAGLGDLPVLGTLQSLDQAVSQTHARTLIVAFSSSADARVNAVIRRCHELGVEVSVIPRMFDTINDRITYESLGGLPLLSFGAVDPRGWQFALKHVFDRLFAAVLLIVLSPVLAAVTAAVALTSPGPVLFRQRRVGRDGKVFDLYKFRSMKLGPGPIRSGADELTAARLSQSDVGPGGVERDKCLTPIGGLLRKLSIDELPQFVNVLKGDMSVIGPRPERPEFADRFSRDIERYEERHRVRSGITGWAQVHGLRGPTSLADRIEWDNYYIAHWSPKLDLKILVLTISALFNGG